MHDRELGQGGYDGLPQVQMPRAVEMDAYDGLPKRLRDTLKDLPLELSAYDISNQWEVTGVGHMQRELVRLARDYYRQIVRNHYGNNCT